MKGFTLIELLVVIGVIVVLVSVGGRVTVRAPLAEHGQEISVTQ